MQLTPEEDFLAKDRERAKNNKRKNVPIVVITYLMTAVFMAMIGYVIYFMQFEAERTIANSRNVRQDSFADKVERGDIITSDGEVIATSTTDENGETKRSYPHGNMFAHVTGYDAHGKAGLELSGNFYMLRTHIQVFERVMKELADEKNRGDNIVTTVRYDLQSRAYNAFGDVRGAAIAIEPSTGKILCMVSKPDFDPNEIDAVWDYMQTEEGAESSILLNRATQGYYAPGSTFKVVTLLEYMREHPNDYENYSYYCESDGTFNDVYIHCYGDTAHGEESLKDSLAYSCNASFANIGVGLNKASYRKTAEELLFNKELPYDGTYVKSSFTIDENSPDYEIPQTAIGQGDTKMTPLHGAMITSAIANGGILMKPYMIERVENDDGAKIKEFKPKTYGALMESSEAKVLTEYMKSVADYGTAAWYFSDASYDVAAKTGTAEYDDEGHSNSWFIGFSNPDDPDLVVCVVTEDVERTGLTSSSVARQLFDAYYGY